MKQYETNGKEGDFTVSVKQSAQLINENCTACGLCTEACPVEPNPAAYIQLVFVSKTLRALR